MNDAAPAQPVSSSQSNLRALYDQALERIVRAADSTWLTSPLRLALIQVIGALLVVVPLLLIPVRKGNDGMMNIVESLGALERVYLWQKAVGDLLGFAPGGWNNLHPILVSSSVRTGLILLFIAQAAAFRTAFFRPGHSLMVWMIGPVLTNIVMLGLVPSNADLFYYEISGDLANQGVDVYVHILSEFPDHPILPYNHWVDMATVYGPLWTRFNQLVMWITGPDPIAATWLYKILMAVMVFALTGLVFWLVKRLTSKPELGIAAAVLVAWQPNMIMEATGQVHADVAMLIFSTLGIALVLLAGRAGVLGGVVLISLSAMIKYVTVPLLGLICLTRLWDRPKTSELLRSWAIDVIAFVAVTVGLFAAFWVGPDTVKEMVDEPNRLFVNPPWRFISERFYDFAPGVVKPYEAVIRTILQLATFAGLIYGLWVVVKPWWNKSDMDASTDGSVQLRQRTLILSWAIVLAVLAYVPANSHPWYWTWPVVPIAVLVTVGASDQREDNPSLPRWFWWYLVFNAAMTLYYHTRIAH